MLYPLILVLTTFLCFFILFMLAKHDFVLLRQNISLSQVFDLASVVFISSFVFGRMFLILNEFKFDMLNLLAFFHIFRYPGISPLGFFLGGGCAIYFSLKNKKGLSRIFDIFSISFLPLFVFFSISNSVILSTFYFAIAIFVIWLMFFIFFVRSHNKYILKDGDISIIFLILICLQSFFENYLIKSPIRVVSIFSPVQIICIFIVLLTIVYFLKKKFFKPSHAR